MAEKATLDTSEPVDPYIVRPSQTHNQELEEDHDMLDEKMTPAFPTQYNKENAIVSGFEQETPEC